MTLPFEPTPDQRKQVEAMSGYGVPQESIAAVIGIDPKTLRHHFREELDLGIAKSQALMGQSLFQRALTSDTLAIFWAKVNLGWKDRVAIEHSGPDGAPIQTANVTLNTNDPVEASKAYQQLINGSD